MEQKQVNATKLARGLVLALALLILPLSGMASAESSAADVDASAEDRLGFGSEAIYIDADTDLDELEPELRDALGHAGLDLQMEGEDRDMAALTDADGPEVEGVVVIITTDGEIAWVVVIVIYDDGSTHVSRHGPVELSAVRERLDGFEGRIIVNWIDRDRSDDVDEDRPCPSGYLHGKLGTDAAGNTIFSGMILNDAGVQIGWMTGTWMNGAFLGTYTLFNGATGTLAGQIGVNTFNGTWSDANSAVDGLLKGYYKYNATTGEGVFKGKWKMLCDEDVRPHPVPRDMVERKPMLERVGEVLDAPVLETESGGVVNIGDAAAGSTLGTIGMLGAGFLRRRITGGL